MDEKVTVAVVRGTNRRATVARALDLIAPDVKRCIQPEVLIKPNLVSHKSQLASTHPDTFSAVLDALLKAGATRITVAEGASDASAGFERFGYHKHAAGKPVHFFDINREETRWRPLTLSALDGSDLHARVSRTITDAPCRVSLALPKTHVTSMITLSLKNMLSSIHPDDRVMMHGSPGGSNGYEGWRKYVVEFLKQDNAPVRFLTRAAGRVKNARTAWNDWCEHGDAFAKLTKAELGFLRSVAAMNRNLVSLSKQVKPHLSVVDGFVGMHREGPRHGTPIALRTVIAGTDAVAVDAVSSAVMGFEPGSIGFLDLAARAGLGLIDVARITIVGDSIESTRKRFVPHSNHAVQRHWARLDLAYRGPHFSMPEPGKVLVR